MRKITFLTPSEVNTFYSNLLLKITVFLTDCIIVIQKSYSVFQTEELSPTNNLIQHFCDLVYNTSFGINFFLYCASGRDFREALSDTILCRTLRRTATRVSLSTRSSRLGTCTFEYSVIVFFLLERCCQSPLTIHRFVVLQRQNRVTDTRPNAHCESWPTSSHRKFLS